MLEAWLSRGDRRMAEVIYRAWKRGARFDAWKEHFNYIQLAGSFADTGLDPAFYTHRERPASTKCFPGNTSAQPCAKNSSLTTICAASAAKPGTTAGKAVLLAASYRLLPSCAGIIRARSGNARMFRPGKSKLQ